MKYRIMILVALWCMTFQAFFAHASDEGMVSAWWTFDALKTMEKIDQNGDNARTIHGKVFVVDKARNILDVVSGAYVKVVTGVCGNSLLLDGNTSFIMREANKTPKLNGDFSVSAWIAPVAYPRHWCPVVDQGSSEGVGYFLGIDSTGHVKFMIRLKNGESYEVQTNESIPLRKWTYITGVLSAENLMTLYVNGRPVAKASVPFDFSLPEHSNLIIGRSREKSMPVGTIRKHGTAAVFSFFDGLIDELEIYDCQLSGDEILKRFHAAELTAEAALPERKIPAGQEGYGRFGAVYTTLKYYDAWDALWRVGDNADVVVYFDEIPGRFVFWRGTSYIPNWVTENGIWYNNEFTETWSSRGCHEPMSDKRCKHSHVRVIENNGARIVIHWRYALVDNWYNMAKVDSLSGWGDWTDEVYTIYPDGIAVRKITLWSTEPESPHEWHEGIIVMGPGQYPESVLEPGALTLANMKGETYTYSWENGLPPEAGKDGFINLPPSANIHLINTKSRYKPFVIVSPESNPRWNIFYGELRPDVSMFPWWNHWPTAQKPSDGIYALTADRASHSSLSHCFWDEYAKGDKSMTKLMLNGLTDKSASELVMLAKSWANPPELRIKSGSGFTNKGYDPSDRSYHLTSDSERGDRVIQIELIPDENSVVVNPAFVFENWGDESVALELKGEKAVPGGDFRCGYHDTIDGTDLVIWIKMETDDPLNPYSPFKTRKMLA